MKIKVDGIPFDVPIGSIVEDALDRANLRGVSLINVNGKPATQWTALKDGDDITTWTNVPDPHDCC